ncbi:hypothetical protein L798_11065, partial [Zootermopsis nevadensis]
NVPNCVGCIDRKHIRLKCPEKSGTQFYNYKQFFPIVLQGVCNANYKFVCVDIGWHGKQSDGGTFAASSLYISLENGSSKLPQNANLSQTDVSLPHVLLGHGAYPLKTYLMKPH